MSARGQVVIPDDVRDRLGLIETAGAVLLQATPNKSGRLLADIETALRAFVRHGGPPVSIKVMNRTIAAMAIDAAVRSDRARGR